MGLTDKDELFEMTYYCEKRDSCFKCDCVFRCGSIRYATPIDKVQKLGWYSEYRAWKSKKKKRNGKISRLRKLWNQIKSWFGIKQEDTMVEMVLVWTLTFLVIFICLGIGWLEGEAKQNKGEDE